MRLVIIGTGPAGITVAEAVRAGDPQAKITLVSTEPFPPYSPPAMADYFETGREAALYWKGRDVADRLGLAIFAPATVTRIDPGAHAVVLGDGRTLSYDRLVVATGSRLYAPVPGNDLEGVANFKSLRAAKSLVERVRRGDARTAVVVGAGFIGVEVALLLRTLGLEVTLLEAEDGVMPRMLDAETARIVGRAVAGRGVKVRLGTRVTAFRGRRKVRGVELEGGERLRADVYVAATGVKPSLGAIDGAGIAADFGILVDDRLRTSRADVFACGDVAETTDRFTGQRYVHAIFPNAVDQARVVAANVLGEDLVYAGAESMNSLKHVGLPVMAVGAKDGEETLRVRHGDVLRKVFLEGGRIVGFRLAGDIRAAGIYRSLMIRRVDVTALRRHLVEPGFAAADLVLSPPGTVRAAPAP